MMEILEDVKLGGHARIISGFAFKSESFVNDGIPVVKIANVKNGEIIFDSNSTQYFPSELATKIPKKFWVTKGDILISLTGSHMTQPGSVVGRVALYRKDSPSLLNQRVGKIDITSPHRIDQNYLYQLLSTNAARQEIALLAQGAANQANVSPKDIEKIKFNILPYPAQKKVGALLKSYDDLIENNKRRIAILEKMAEEIYREWFVRMRFPGHENTKFEKGKPVDWKVVELNKICREASKSTKAGPHLENRVYLPLDLLATRQMLPSDHLDYTEAQSSLVTFQKDDILFGAMRPYQHKVAMAPFDGITRTTCFVIRPNKPISYSFLYLTLFQPSAVEYASLICNGSDRPYVVWKRGMERMNIFQPSDFILERFENTVRPMLDFIKEQYFVLRNLKQTRDLLLPRLISGKLSVEGLDIQFPTSMVEGMKDEG